MLLLSTTRLPIRWRLALAAGRGASRSTSTTAAATTLSPHTPTIPQWRAHAAAANAPQYAHQDDKKARAKARKAAKRAAKLNPQPTSLPECTPFGAFEDVIQPIALTLWGGKVKELQSTPKLTYQAEFLGPTSFWRVQVRSKTAETENNLWRVLWRDTRPDTFVSSKMRKEIEDKEMAASKGKRNGNEAKDEENQNVDEENETVDSGKESGKQATKGVVPPLEAVVQDVFNRYLARLAYEKTPQQKRLEEATRQRAQRRAERGKEEPVETEKEEENTPEFKINFRFQNPHTDRLPFEARHSMRHFDICGPLPRYARQSSLDEMNYFWTEKGGNVLVNHFPLDRVSKMKLSSGVSVLMWKGQYNMTEMARFVSNSRRNKVEREKEADKAAAQEEKGLEPRSLSPRMLAAHKERLRQLDFKSAILTKSDGGWKKILDVVAHETRSPPPLVTAAGRLSFAEAPHPDRDTIDAVWGPRMAARRHHDALADYAAFLSARMEAGHVPATVSPAAKEAGSIKRGWQNPKRRKRLHPGKRAKMIRKVFAEE